jgi:tyrosyl-tRNA synthetase
MVQGGGVSLNKVKVENPDLSITLDLLLNKKYLLIQKGKKNYFLIRIV